MATDPDAGNEQVLVEYKWMLNGQGIIGSEQDLTLDPSTVAFDK